MRLFGKVDGAINRFDRAAWLTLGFDLALSEAPATITFPLIVSACEVFSAGSIRCDVFHAGAVAREVFSGGAIFSEVSAK